MGRILKNIFITIGLLAVMVIAYRSLFIRTVYYEIGGAKIPSEYNILTKKARPINSYTGIKNLPIIKSFQVKNVGLSDDQAALAKLRWGIFEEWANTRPEYKGWQESPEIFQKARSEYEAKMGNVKTVVIK